LVARVPASVIAKRFDVSIDSVKRHGRNHLSAVQVAALATAMRPSGIDLEELREREGSSLLGQLLAQRATLQTYGQSAFEAKQYQAAISAERAVTDNLDLLSRVLGLIITKHETRSTHLLIHPDYLALRSTLVEALRPFPEAAAAVGKALHALESKAADDITKANGKLIEHRPEEAKT
jgi:UDP-glucose 6-dehydrogenase